MKLKIGSFNIQRANNHAYLLQTKNKKRETKPISDFIAREGLDVCGLQEVCLNDQTPYCVPEMCRNHAKGIADALGYEYAFGLATDETLAMDGGYGVAIVSRYPIVSKRTVAIPSPKKEDRKYTGYYEDRVLLIVDIDIDGKILTVINTHYGLNPDEMDRALEITKRELENIDGEVVLIGDLNITAKSSYYEELKAMLVDTSPEGTLPYTFPSDSPSRKIDYIFTSDKIASSNPRAANDVISDHLPYMADVEL